MHKTFPFTVWLAVVVLLTAMPLAVASPPPTPPPSDLAPFDPYILTVIEAEGQANFYVVLKIQADLSAASSLPNKEARGQYVFDALTEVAAKTQGPILEALKTEGATFKPMWIRNMVKVRGDKALLLKMAARPDVAEIIYEHKPILDVESLPPTANAAPNTPEWNITRVHAPDVWALGITGAGAVVGDLDTGVQWDHPALINSYRGNLGGGNYDHNYNWYDGGYTTVPTDYDTHGTHTMGTIVGDDGAGNQIGMAPGAKWIACPGVGSPYVGPFECFQWFLAPTDLYGQNPQPALAPHVINNSWSSAGTDYHPIIQTLTAAGIFYAKSAGNTGPGCSTITNPGQWPEVTATAAFAQGDTIASFSSRGPMTIGHDLLVKPDIAAPGVNVRSSVPGNGYGSYQGTSMACPHVTGAVALLVSARPDLAGRVDILQMLLKQTAEPKISVQCPPYVDHPNDVWGWGILNIYAAVQAAQALGLGGIEGQVVDSSRAPIADAEITIQDAATGWSFFDSSNAGGEYSHTLPAATYNLTATHYGYLPGMVSSVVVQDGLTTTQNLTLEVAPLWTVSGVVTETQTGNPLAAHLVFEETPITADTDPVTGAYSATVAQGTWWMMVTSPGHAKAERQVTVDQDLTENWSLMAIQNYYMREPDDCNGPAFSWMDAGGGTARCLSDDSYVTVNLPTGRTFTFYGQSYNALFVGSNGLVTFGQPNSKWSGPIPDPATPNNGIYAFSTDLNPASCSQGTIYTDYLQDRYFVIEWLAVQHYPNGNPETFEIILDLNTDRVTIQHLTVSDPTNVVVGVENADGTEATQYAYSDPALITDSTAVDFYPIFGTPPPGGDAGELSGTVTDATNGDPIAGATVHAVAFTGGELFTFTTDTTGLYSATLCADRYDVAATAPGYYPGDQVQTAVYSGTTTVQDFALQPITADLWIAKTAPLTATLGAYLTYTLDFGSRGPDSVSLAELWDGLPDEVEYITSTGGTYSQTAHAVTWQVTNLVSGFVGSTTLVVQVTGVFTDGRQVCNEARFLAAGEAAPQDPDPTNNVYTVCTTIAVPPPPIRYHYVYLPLVVKGAP